MASKFEQKSEVVGGRIEKRQRADAMLLAMFELEELPEQRMTAKEHRKFGKRIASGDQIAKQEYLLRRLRFVMMIAISEEEAQLESSGLTLEDHFQNIIEAMQRRLNEYPMHGHEDFKKYMGWSYRLAEREYNDTAELIGLPSHIHEKLKKREKYEKQIGRVPSSEEVALAINITDEEAVILEQIVERRQHDTLPLKMAEQIPDPDMWVSDEVILAVQAEQLRQAIKGLSVREKRVLGLRFGLTGEQPMTQKEVGERFDVSHSIISRIEIKALKKLKDITQDFLDPSAR